MTASDSRAQPDEPNDGVPPLEVKITTSQLDIKTNWPQIVTAAVALLSVLAVLVTLENTIDATREQIDATRKQQELAEQGQNADRFSRAIDQIGQAGKDKLYIRLGGIYALQSLMTRDDQAQVVDVLSAYVRGQLPADGFPTDVPPSIDLQAALTVLGRSPKPSDVDLSNANLTKADLTGARLAGADLHLTYFAGANVSGADLSGANLHDTNMDSTDLTRARLANADLHGADMPLANLTGADLTGANLTGAKLPGAVLVGANFAGALLNGVDLRDVDVRPAINFPPEVVGCAYTNGGTKLPATVRPIRQCP
jgi:hypothetical protein